MTRERRQDVLIVALVLSAALHFGVMFYARTQVMAKLARGKNAAERTVPMQVVKTVPMTDAAKIEELLDLKPDREAPEAERVPLPDEAVKVEIPASEKVAPLAIARDKVAPPPEQIAFDAEVADETDAKPRAVPVLAIDTPLALMTADTVMPLLDTKPTQTVLPAPAPVAAVPSGPAGDGTGEGGGVAGEKRRITRPVEKPKPEFKPSETVYEKVEEQVVAEEKAAVKLLVDQEEAVELVKFVNVAMVKENTTDGVYFKVLVTPRASLQPVPKDVVVLIDASGSIGKDRMGSIRKSAKRILRSATNSGDRFNLVAFRNSFTYAFRSWQNCTQSAFDRSDAWLDELAAHGRTDVFSTIASVLTLPRDPKRPLIALVVTDGDANSGVSDNAEILRRFTELNGGLVSVYMYGVKSSANRELIDVLTHGNRGESLIFGGWSRWGAGDGIEPLSERFRDPVLSDLALVFATGCRAETYPRYLKNLYRGGTLEVLGKAPAGTKEIAFSLKGLNGATAYEGFFRLPFDGASARSEVAAEWQREREIDSKLK